MSQSIPNARRPRKTLRHLAVGIAASMLTVVQVLWAAPNAPSDADPGASPLRFLLTICVFALVLPPVLLASLPRGMRVAVRAGTVASVLAVYWLLLNYSEFVLRVAAWSTFETDAVMLHVLQASALPVIVCAGILLLVTRRSLRQ